MFLDDEGAKAELAYWKAVAQERREHGRKYAEEMERNALSIGEHHKLTPVSSEILVRAEQVKRLDDRLREQ